MHLHSLVCDGVFVADGSGVRFCELRAPTTDDITAVAEQVCKRVLRLLTKRGLWVDGVLQTAANDEPPDVLEHISAASVQGTLVFASGARPMRLVATAAGAAPIALKGYAFDVDASVRVHGNDRAKLERLCRYLLRPPIANDRVTQRTDGRFVLQLKRPWSDGTTHLVFDGPELIARLVALIPPPRVHRVRYHGVFAPRAKLRDRIVRPPPAASASADSPDVDAPYRPCGHQRTAWAKLLMRVFAVEVLAVRGAKPADCNALLSSLEPSAIRAILASVGLATAPPERKPAVRQTGDEIWG